MNVLYVPDSYGGFLTASNASERVTRRLTLHGLRAVGHPLSDGGEGLCEILQHHLGGTLHSTRVSGPYGDPTLARWLHLDQTVVVESAQAIGLALSPRRQPLQASSSGLGELLGELRNQHPRIILGLGGSATVDAGMGMLQALGARLRCSNHEALVQPFTAGQLETIEEIRWHGDDWHQLEVLADVTTPFLDAPAVFGPQKGLQAGEIAPLTRAFERLTKLLEEQRLNHKCTPLPVDLPGGGAAGGISYVLQAVLNATAHSGAQCIADMTGLDARLDQAQVVVLGEGRLDPPSLAGKVAGEVITRARARGLKIVALVGAARDLPHPPAGPDHVIETGEPTMEAFDRATDTLAGWLHRIR
ncbi:MAG: glycerate kinase [Myxococcota bacterium]|nr:glycerate kinase [Myxococcota bacterium]